MKKFKNFLITAITLSCLIGITATTVRAVWLYSTNGAFTDVYENEVNEYLSNGWYEYPVVRLYAEDGRSEVFPESIKEAQLTVGWYESPEVTLYAPDGRSATFPISKRSAQLTVGWYPYPVETLYASDGRSIVIPKEQEEDWLKVGWYREYTEMYDNYGQKKYVHWTFMKNPEEHGYYREPQKYQAPPVLSYDEKFKRVFPLGKCFETQDEADANMTEITVPVWGLKSDGTKYPSTRTMKVNANLAEDVVKIFKEIYNDPSRFPMNSVFGYTWRNSASGNISQHSYGTCIDINPNENYYVKPDGTPITGTHWTPGEDPYSIAEDSIVVQTFAKYGWEWGGNAWSERNNKDYMHFTYLGG